MTLEELLWACFLGVPVLIWAILQAIAWHDEHLWIPEDREEQPMQLEPQQKAKLVQPGTIWQRRKNGEYERVYLESTFSKLLRDGSKEVDIRTPFGLEHIPLAKFLIAFEFLGWARLKLKDLTSDKNLLPLTEDISAWTKSHQK